MRQDSPTPSVSAPRIFTPEYYARMRDLEDASWWNAGMRDVAALLLDTARLPPAAKECIQLASVIGQRFGDRVLRAAGGDRIADAVDTLISSDLVGLLLAVAAVCAAWARRHTSASSRSSRRPRASLVAVPNDGIRSPRIRREIVE